jgi:uncharacterized protein YqgV (UPF0045/DUF77 family)
MQVSVDVETKQYRLFKRRATHDIQMHLWATKVSTDIGGTTYFWFMSEVIAVLDHYSDLGYEVCPSETTIETEAEAEMQFTPMED